jgi:hypothetical protein
MTDRRAMRRLVARPGRSLVQGRRIHGGLLLIGLGLGVMLTPSVKGTILVSDLAMGNRSYVLAMIVLAVPALVGLAIAGRLPANSAYHQPATSAPPS